MTSDEAVWKHLNIALLPNYCLFLIPRERLSTNGHTTTPAYATLPISGLPRRSGSKRMQNDARPTQPPL